MARTKQTARKSTTPAVGKKAKTLASSAPLKKGLKTPKAVKAEPETRPTGPVKTVKAEATGAKAKVLRKQSRAKPRAPVLDKAKVKRRVKNGTKALR